MSNVVNDFHNFRAVSIYIGYWVYFLRYILIGILCINTWVILFSGRFDRDLRLQRSTPNLHFLLGPIAYTSLRRYAPCSILKGV